MKMPKLIITTLATLFLSGCALPKLPELNLLGPRDLTPEELEAQRRIDLENSGVHTRKCEAAFDDIRSTVKIGMSSPDIRAAMNGSWVHHAMIHPIGPRAGWIPLELSDKPTLEFLIALYPNQDDFSNYTVYVQLTRPEQIRFERLSSFCRRFLTGNLRDPKIKILQYALDDNVNHIERLPHPLPLEEDILTDRGDVGTQGPVPETQ